ncbi:MAG TPA: hypothetical protein VFI27_02460 [candidate division Zixibacteria bacterium]|nr:hypothetical protein [candidate division Zixibacteria bacterium]
MPQALANTIVVFIGLVIFGSTIFYNYTIVADYLGDETGWFIWRTIRLQLLGRHRRDQGSSDQEQSVPHKSHQD